MRELVNWLRNGEDCEENQSKLIDNLEISNCLQFVRQKMGNSGKDLTLEKPGNLQISTEN